MGLVLTSRDEQSDRADWKECPTHSASTISLVLETSTTSRAASRLSPTTYPRYRSSFPTESKSDAVPQEKSCASKCKCNSHSRKAGKDLGLKSFTIVLWQIVVIQFDAAQREDTVVLLAQVFLRICFVTEDNVKGVTTCFAEFRCSSEQDRSGRAFGCCSTRQTR